jgi:hypothetical protein
LNDLLPRILDALDRARIPYMLTGSFASSFHGAPRATQDIDFVISPTVEQIRELARALPPSEYYLDEEAAVEAQRRRGQFNVIDFATGSKIDLIVRKSRPFSLREFERRQLVDFEGMKLTIATPEDLVVAKLEWAKLGGSERQIEDAAGVLRIRGNDLDTPYLLACIEELRLREQWDEARRRAGAFP